MSIIIKTNNNSEYTYNSFDNINSDIYNLSSWTLGDTIYPYIYAVSDTSTSNTPIKDPLIIVTYEPVFLN